MFTSMRYLGLGYGCFIHIYKLYILCSIYIHSIVHYLLCNSRVLLYGDYVSGLIYQIVIYVMLFIFFLEREKKAIHIHYCGIVLETIYYSVYCRI